MKFVPPFEIGDIISNTEIIYSSLRFFLITGEIFKIKDQQTGEKPHNYGRKSLHLNLIYGMM